MPAPVYDAGNRRIALLDVQRARGTAQSWVAVLPALRTELKALDAFLGAPGADGFVRCSDEADAEAAWQDLRRAFDFLRLVCARPLRPSVAARAPRPAGRGRAGRLCVQRRHPGPARRLRLGAPRRRAGKGPPVPGRDRTAVGARSRRRYCRRRAPGLRRVRRGPRRGVARAPGRVRRGQPEREVVVGEARSHASTGLRAPPHPGLPRGLSRVPGHGGVRADVPQHHRGLPGPVHRRGVPRAPVRRRLQGRCRWSRPGGRPSRGHGRGSANPPGPRRSRSCRGDTAAGATARAPRARGGRRPAGRGPEGRRRRRRRLGQRVGGARGAPSVGRQRSTRRVHSALEGGAVGILEGPGAHAPEPAAAALERGWPTWCTSGRRSSASSCAGSVGPSSGARGRPAATRPPRCGPRPSSTACGCPWARRAARPRRSPRRAATGRGSDRRAWCSTPGPVPPRAPSSLTP